MVIDRELSQRETVARFLADSTALDGAPNLTEADLRAFYEQARRATEGLGGWVVLSTPNGQILNTLRPFGDGAAARGRGTVERLSVRHLRLDADRADERARSAGSSSPRSRCRSSAAVRRR